MPKYGPELEPAPAKAKPEPKQKSITDKLTEMQSEMKTIAEAESKKPFGGNMRSAINKLKEKAAEEDQKMRDSTENVVRSAGPTKGA